MWCEKSKNMSFWKTKKIKNMCVFWKQKYSIKILKAQIQQMNEKQLYVINIGRNVSPVVLWNIPHLQTHDT